MIQLRYMVVRNLIVLQHLLLNNFALNCNAMEIIRSKCIPDSEVFLQSYYVMNWIAESTVDYAAIRRYGARHMDGKRYKDNIFNCNSLVFDFTANP